MEEQKKDQSWVADEAELKEGDEKPIIRELRPEEQSEQVKKFEGKFYNAFHYDYVDADGNHRIGVFVVRRLTIGELGKVGVEAAAMNGGQQVDYFTDWLHGVLAYLRYALVYTPDWWSPPEDLYDPIIVRSVFDYTKEWEKSFRHPDVGKRRRKATCRSADASTDGLAPNLVVQEVQPPA